MQPCLCQRVATSSSSLALWRLQIAGALMLWLECLPEPLIPQRLYWPFLHAAREGDAETRRTKVQMLLRQVSAPPG